MKTNAITISAKVKAKLEDTWEYYTQPNHITQWNFATDDWECPSASNDLRIGGKYTARMQAKDGSFGFDFEGTYNVVKKHRELVYTMPDNRTVSIQFENIGEQTKVIIIFDAEKENALEMQQAGWQAILDNFKQYVEDKAVSDDMDEIGELNY